MQNINEEILIYLNSLTDYKLIENISLCFSDGPIFILPIFLILAWLYYTFKVRKNSKKKDLLFIFYGTVIAVTINLIIQNFIQFDRPESALEGVGKLILNHIPDASFPSDHAGVSFAFLTGLFLAGYKKIGYILIIPFILMSISRVIVGVHWPFDIIGGMVVGVSSAFISFKLLKKISFINSINSVILNILNYIKL